MGTQKTLPPSVTHSVKGVPKHSFWGGDAACVSAARALHTGARQTVDRAFNLLRSPLHRLHFPYTAARTSVYHALLIMRH